MDSEPERHLAAVQTHVSALANEVLDFFRDRKEKPTTLVMVCLMLAQAEIEHFDATTGEEAGPEVRALLAAIQPMLDRMVAARVNRMIWEGRPRG